MDYYDTFGDDFSDAESRAAPTGFSFSHTIAGFTPERVLAAVGITPATRGPSYYVLVDQTVSIIASEVLTSAKILNGMLQTVYAKDMANIEEYARFPRYMRTMALALSRPEHVGMHWSRGGRPQADIIDTSLLGDLGDLQRIQRMVNPGGTLRGWIGVYNAWRLGENQKYEEVVNARLDIMESEGIAPFWQLIEDGNGPYAYPNNGPMRTLLTFRSTYLQEMRAAYARCISAVRMLTASAPAAFQGLAADFLTYNGRTYYGFAWVSKSGKNIFSISGQSGIDSAGRTFGRGFILDDIGQVLKEWRGWLPR